MELTGTKQFREGLELKRATKLTGIEPDIPRLQLKRIKFCLLYMACFVCPGYSWGAVRAGCDHI